MGVRASARQWNSCFLTTSGDSSRVDYYERLPKDDVSAVATLQLRTIIDARGSEVTEHFIFEEVPTFDQVRSADACKDRGGTHVEVAFPSTSSLTLTPVQTLEFLHHRASNHKLRGPATRPPQRDGMEPQTA